MSLFQTMLGNLTGTATSNAFSPASNVMSYGANGIAPTNIIPYEKGSILHQLGYISNQAWWNISRMHGFTNDSLTTEQSRLTFFGNNGQAGLAINNFQIPLRPHNRFIQLNKNWPSIQETLFLRNRNLIDDFLMFWLLKMNTNNEPGLMEAWAESRFEIPGPSDLIHFAVREAFSPDIVQQFGYHKELPIAIIPWMEKQGYGGVLNLPIPPGATTTQGNEERTFAQWFDLYWWSHWILVSPTQASEMLFRGYEFSDFGPSPYVKNVDGSINHNRTFNRQQYQSLLKASDYPQFWRERLEMISERTLTRVDVRRMYRLRIFTLPDVYHAYRAMGYNDFNAKSLMEFTEQSERLAGAKKHFDLTVAQLNKLYMDGVLDSDDLRNRLFDLEMPMSEIQAHIANLDLMIKHQAIKIAIQSIRHAFLHGFFDEDLTRQSLTQLEIVHQARERYIRLWKLKKFGERKYVAARKHLAWYSKRLQSREITIGSLVTLGYTFLETEKMLAEADFDLNVIRGKQLERIERERIKDERNKQKAIEKAKEKQRLELIREAKTEIANREKQFRKALSAYTDKNIIAFFTNKQLEKDDIETILNARGWKEEAIEAWIETYIEPLEEEEEENEEEIEEEA